MLAEAERFWPKVDRTEDHWLWTASTNGEAGYGSFGVRDPETGEWSKKLAHVWAWESVHGPKPAGMDLDHTCRVRLCVRPDHLELVTHRENLLRGDTLVAAQAALTHCTTGGHDLSVHAYVSKQGKRQCRLCRNSLRRGERRAHEYTNPSSQESRAVEIVTFGKPAAQRKAERAQRSGSFYLKTFRDPETKIRFLQDDPNTWIEYREHFDKGARISYPCARAEGAEYCVGCAQDDEKTSASSSRWLVLVLDERDYVQVYKIGVKFWKTLIGHHQLFGTLTDKDYAVLRQGESFNDISYTAIPIGSPYPRQPKIDAPSAEELSKILSDKYVEALAHYGVEPDESAFDEPEVPASANPDPAARALENAKATATTAPTEPEKEEVAKPASEPEQDSPAATPTDLPSFREMSTPDLRTWLKEKAVEFPANAPRSRLVTLAEKAAVGF